MVVHFAHAVIWLLLGVLGLAGTFSEDPGGSARHMGIAVGCGSHRLIEGSWIVLLLAGEVGHALILLGGEVVVCLDLVDVDGQDLLLRAAVARDDLCCAELGLFRNPRCRSWDSVSTENPKMRVLQSGGDAVATVSRCLLSWLDLTHWRLDWLLGPVHQDTGSVSIIWKGKKVTQYLI